MNEGHNGNGVLVHTIDNPVVSDKQLPICTAFVFRDLSAGFGEVPSLLNPLLDVQSEGLGIAGRIRFDEGYQCLEVVGRNSRPD